MDFDRVRDEDAAAYLRGLPPPKPAEPQNQIRKTDWLGVEYPDSTFDPNLPESNDNPRRTAHAFGPQRWERRRRRLAYVAMALPALFALGAAVALVLISCWG
jgi:hypothetical protein